MNNVTNLTTLYQQSVAFREELAGRERFPINDDRSYYLTEGIIYVYQGKCFSWSRQLKTPNEYCPGVIAVSCDGQCFRANGGNDRDGATQWDLIDS